MRGIYIIQCKYLEWFSSLGMAHLGFLVLVKDKEHKHHQEILNHELIHIAQQRETLVVMWYIFYILDWLYKFLFHTQLFKKGGGFISSFWKAYKKITFEREAFYYEKDYNYLNIRRHFNWVKFLKNDN